MRERGSVTIWMLGLTLLILVFGGVAIDFWRALSLQRELAAIADSSAIAAASGIDEESYRADGVVTLDPDRARILAAESVAFQGLDPESFSVMLNPTRTSVTVHLSDELELGLLGVLTGDSKPIEVRAVASALPRLVP